MIKKKIISRSLSENENVIDYIFQLINFKKVFLFNASMGAGKTTLINIFLKRLGIVDFNGSPTYSLVNEYISPHFGKVYHLDLYRLNSLKEALDIGIEELIDKENILIIEWPDLIKELFDNNEFVEIKIKVNEKNIREFEIKYC